MKSARVVRAALAVAVLLPALALAQDVNHIAAQAKAAMRKATSERRYEEGPFLVEERNDLAWSTPLENRTRVVARDKAKADELSALLRAVEPDVCGGVLLGYTGGVTPACPSVSSLSDFLASLPENVRAAARKDLEKDLSGHEAVILRDVHANKNLSDPALGGRL